MTKALKVPPKSAPDKYSYENILPRNNALEQLTEVSKDNPCPHCGKPDWCYSLGELTVCNRESEPSTGWVRTNKTDSNGRYYYAPEKPKKRSRKSGRTEHKYTDNQGNPTIKVVVVRPGRDGKDKDVYQEYWGGDILGWQPARKISKEQKKEFQTKTTLYRYSEIQKAIADNPNQPIFIVEGESIVDTLWKLGITATTSIGGAGKYKKYGEGYKKDLQDAQNIVLCPDRDKPGLRHMDDVNEDFPDAKWLYAPPNDFYWKKLPKSGGCDIADWIQDGATVEQIFEAVEDKRIFADYLNQSLESSGESIYSDDERLRLAILDLSQEKNKIAYIRKRAQICSHYGISKTEIEELIRDSTRNTSTTGLKRTSLDSLLDMEIEELRWLIPELLPSGEMIVLAGSPKSGKTLMAIDVAFAIATGEDEFLGLKPQQGKVLLISNDENARSTKSKLLKRGFRYGDNLEILFDWNISQMYELEQLIDDYRPNVVIIDSLKSITANNAEISENNAEFANNIYLLKNLFNRYNAASILIHHTNKDKDAVGVHKLRGSTAIAGAVWGTWQLEQVPVKDPETKKLKIDPSNPKRLLAVHARDIEGQLLALEFDPENNTYIRIDKEVLEEQATLSDRVLGVLRMNPQGLTGKGIIECLGMDRDEGRKIYSILNRMEAKRLISTTKSSTDKRATLYTTKKTQHSNVTECKLLNTQGDSLPPTQCAIKVDKSSKKFTQQELQNRSQENKNRSQNTENRSHLSDTRCTDECLKSPPSKEEDELIANSTHRGGGVSIN